MLVVCVTSLNIVSSSIRLPSNFTFLYTQKTSGDFPFLAIVNSTAVSRAQQWAGLWLYSHEQYMSKEVAESSFRVKGSHWGRAHGSWVTARGPTKPLPKAVKVKAGFHCGPLGRRQSHVMSAKKSCIHEVEPTQEREVCCGQQSWKGGALEAL